jgi:hypothetical protein
MGLIITEEHVIKNGPLPVDGVKSIEFVTHRPEMSIPDFQRYWREVHGPLAVFDSLCVVTSRATRGGPPTRAVELPGMTGSR